MKSFVTWPSLPWAEWQTCGGDTGERRAGFLFAARYFGSYDEAVFGGILVLVMLFAPNGILMKMDWLKKRQSQGQG